SAACKDPQFVAEAARRFGSQCIVVNIDPKRVRKGAGDLGLEAKGSRSAAPSPQPLVPVVFEVHINGGRVPTGLEAVSWAKNVEELGAGEIVLTSMDADGTKAGYDLEMTRAVSE